MVSAELTIHWLDDGSTWIETYPSYTAAQSKLSSFYYQDRPFTWSIAGIAH